MALSQITFSAPLQVNERSSMMVTARFRDRAAMTDVTPTNAYWRLDDQDGCQLTDWTSISPATQVSITISGEQNRNLNCSRPSETKILTVMADRGLAGQFTASYSYTVKNLPWQA